MTHSDQGMIKDQMGQEQPTDKARAQTAHQTDARTSAPREATREPKPKDAETTPGSGMAPDDHDSDPTG